MDWKDKTLKIILQASVRDVEAARDEVIKSWKETLMRSGRIGEETLSPYSRSHANRRRYAGRQVRVKDLMFSNTMRESLKEVQRDITADKVEVTVGFTGEAHRRKDQQNMTNVKLAERLSNQQMGGGGILKLSNMEKERIERKYNVIIQVR